MAFRGPSARFVAAIVIAAAPAAAEQTKNAPETNPAVAEPASAEASDLEPSGRRVSAEEILSFAHKNAPVVRVARAGLSRGRAELEAARPILPSDPVLSGEVGRRRRSTGSGWDYGVRLEQEVELFGQRAKRLELASATALLGSAELSRAQWRAHQRVHAAYYAALGARERLRAAKRVLNFADRLLDVTRRRAAAGETSSLPARLAGAEHATARQNVVAAAQRYRSTLLVLAESAGWPTSPLPIPSDELVAPRPAPSLSRLLAVARAKDPELAALGAAVGQAQARLRYADRGTWGNPRLSAAFARESDPGGSPATIWSGAVSMPLPIALANRPERVRAQAELEVARAEQSAYSQTLRSRLERARSTVDAAARRAAIYGKEIVPTFGKNLELVEKAFDLGEIDITQVLVARERFLRSQEEALDAYDDYHRASGDLEAEVGAELWTAPTRGGVR